WPPPAAPATGRRRSGSGDYLIPGSGGDGPEAEALDLQHLYRAMAWLGEELKGGGRQAEATPFSPRCTKELLEEALFARRREPFGIAGVCVVADRGMIGRRTVAALEDEHRASGTSWGRGCVRSDHEVRDTVLAWPGRYHEVHAARWRGKDPSPLKVKDVRFTG